MTHLCNSLQLIRRMKRTVGNTHKIETVVAMLTANPFITVDGNELSWTNPVESKFLNWTTLFINCAMGGYFWMQNSPWLIL